MLKLELYIIVDKELELYILRDKGVHETEFNKDHKQIIMKWLLKVI